MNSEILCGLDKLPSVTGLELPLVKYDPEVYEINPNDFRPSRPYYQISNSNYFHPEFTASGYAASLSHAEHSHHRKHHEHNHHHRSLSRQDSTMENETTLRKRKEIRELLAVYIPPRDFQNEETGKYYRQDVSCQPSSIQETKALTDEVENRLDLHFARQTGYCPFRREIFTDCFDEVLRQIITEEPTTGILLGRMRDEIRMTLDCWRRLEQNIQAFGSRKTIEQQYTGEDSERLVGGTSNLSQELVRLRKLHERLSHDIGTIESDQAHVREMDKTRRHDEITFYRNISKQLNHQMEKVRAQAKQSTFLGQPKPSSSTQWSGTNSMVSSSFLRN